MAHVICRQHCPMLQELKPHCLVYKTDNSPIYCYHSGGKPSYHVCGLIPSEVMWENSIQPATTRTVASTQYIDLINIPYSPLVPSLVPSLVPCLVCILSLVCFCVVPFSCYACYSLWNFLRICKHNHSTFVCSFHTRFSQMYVYCTSDCVRKDTPVTPLLIQDHTDHQLPE